MANFNYTANVKCVNGTTTWIEIIFPSYPGVIATDVEAISITGPSGLMTNDLADFYVYEDMNYILFEVLDVVPELGQYDFSVTINGETLLGSDTQTVNRTLPTINNLTISPGLDESTTTDITFTWEAVPDPGFTVYYGIQIKNIAGDFIANVRYIGNYQFDINLQPGDYIWQIIVMDGVDWTNTNNRTHGNWAEFTII